MPNETPIVPEVAPTEELSSSIAAALRPEFSIWVGLGASPTSPDGRAVFDVSSLPTPVAYEVYCRSGSKEWFLGTIDSSRRGEKGAIQVFSSMTVTIGGGGTTSRRSNMGGARATATAPMAGFDSDTQRVDIVLRPSEKAAAETVDLDTYYGGEIVIPNVPVAPDTMLRPDEEFRRTFEQTRPAIRSGPARRRTAQ